MRDGYESIIARATSVKDRLKGKYPVGPIQANGEPEFGYRIFETLPDGKPFPAIQTEASDMIAELLGELTLTRHRLQSLLDYVDVNTCKHENTHRGGVQWTICANCGAKWADGEGGFKPHEDAPVVQKARELLDG